MPVSVGHEAVGKVPTAAVYTLKCRSPVKRKLVNDRNFIAGLLREDSR